MGVGLASVLAAFCIDAYYNVIIAWALIYLISSFINPLPWSLTYTVDINQTTKKCPDLFITQEFFFKDLVKTYKDDCTPIDTSSVIIDESIFMWEVYLSTLAVWVIVYFCIWKGVQSSSYIVWITVPLPVIFIIIMVINNLTLPNASNGIKMYIKGYDLEGNPPDVAAKLGDGQMWAEACGQIFFSLGICMGSMTAYSSFNPRDKPIIGDAFRIALTNSGISFIAGFAVFSVVGYLQGIGSPVADKTASIGLAFIAYPAAIETMDGSNGWSFILAVTLFTLGIDSAFSILEAVSTVMQDAPVFANWPRKLIALLLCILGALGSILFSFNWGFTYFDVVDHFLNVYLMLLIGILETFGAGWVFEYSEVATDRKMKLALGVQIVGYWAPLVILAPISMWALEGMSWVGIVIFWAIQVVVLIASFCLSGLKFKDWYSRCLLYGVRKLSRAMTKLSKTPGQTHRSWWEPIFEFWWGMSIKYFVPFAVWFLMMFSLKADTDSAYGGYHNFWQVMGWLYPLGGFIAFIIPVFFPPAPMVFDKEMNAAFEEEDYSGTGAASSMAAMTAGDPSNKVGKGEVELAEGVAIQQQ